MQTVDKKMVALVERLARVSKARKECEKIEKHLKEDVKLFMGNNKILDAGLFSVIINTRTRSDIDLERLRFSFGREMLRAFERMTSYDVVEVVVNTVDIEVLKTLEFHI